MQQMRFRLDSQSNFLTEREALERLTHYLNFTVAHKRLIVLPARKLVSSQEVAFCTQQSGAGTSAGQPTAASSAMASLPFNMK